MTLFRPSGVHTDLHEFLDYFCSSGFPQEFAKNGNGKYLYRIFFHLERNQFPRFILNAVIVVYVLARVKKRFPSMLLGCRNSCVLNDTRQNLKTILEYSAEDGFLKENVGVFSGASLTKYGSPGLNIVLSAILRAYTCCKPYRHQGSMFSFKYIMESSVYFFLFQYLLDSEPRRYAITACDHSPAAAGFLFAAINNNIYTISVQHGMLSSLVHPPAMADLTVLFDLRSKNIYDLINKNSKKRGFKGEVQNNFEIRNRDSHIEYFRRDDFLPNLIGYRSLALVLNQRTTAKLVKFFIKSHADLLANASIIVCPHPHSGRGILKALAAIAPVRRFSEVDCELYICGNTSSMFDLLACGKKVVYSSCLDEVGHDYYGMVRDGLVLEFEDLI